MTSQLAIVTLGKYRKLLRLINRLPKEAKERAREEARSEMSKHKLADESEAVLLREYMDDKIRYLRIMTPKRPGDDEYLGGSTYYVVRDGKVVEGTATREKRIADGKISMAEAHDLHAKLLKRQHFGKTPPKYDPSTF